jgi:NitT/TauT family transport system substrate-binding protein
MLSGKRFGLAVCVVQALSVMAISPAPSRAADPQPVRLQDAGPTINSFLELYARAFGLFEKEGVKLVMNPPIYNASAIVQTIVTGQADIGFGGGAGIIPAIAQGRPLKAFAVITEGLDLNVSLSKAAAEKLAQKGITPKSPFKDRLQALRGLKLAAPATGSTTYQGIQYELKKNGIDPAKDLTIQPLADMAAIIAVVRQGAVDGAMGTFGGANGQVEADGGIRFISFDAEDPAVRTVPLYVLTASDDYLRANTENVRRVARAFQQAKVAVRRGLTAEELETVKKQFFPDMSPATYQSLIKNTIPLLTGGMAATKEQFDTLIAINNVSLDVPVKLTFDQVFDNRIADSIDRK